MKVSWTGFVDGAATFKKQPAHEISAKGFSSVWTLRKNRVCREFGFRGQTGTGTFRRTQIANCDWYYVVSS
jgi:hypothetical protein